MNFTFEVGDIVVLRSDSKGLDMYVLAKGFDPTPSGHRVWWADPWDGQRSFPTKRIRTYSKDLIRLRRPKEEARLKARAERWAQIRAVARFTRLAREEIRKRAALRKKGFVLNDLPFTIPPGKWLTPQGVRQILTDAGFKPETVEKRVQIAERLSLKRRL